MIDRQIALNRLSVFAAALLGTVLGGPALAQDSPAAESELALEEVVVTARKREESLQDVPITVTAITADRIEELRITAPDDIARFTPGFSYVSSFGRLNSERPTVRGQTNIIGAANASFFVDGVYVSGPSVSTETANLERIEVIKGPQAALYGRATFAGAINFITKRPSNEFNGKLSLSAGQHGEREANVFATGPIAEGNLFYYVGARYWDYEGEYTNVIDGKPAGSQRTISGTAKLLWTPSENFEATLLATKSTDNDEGSLALGLQGRDTRNCQLRAVAGNVANNFAGTVLPRSPGYFCGTVASASDLVVSQRTDVMTDPGLDRNSLRVALTTKTTFGGGYTLTTVSGYHDEDQESQIDVSYDGYDAFANTFGTAPNPMTGLTQQGVFWRQGAEEREDFQQEIRLDSPADRRFRWRLGGYYFKANDDTTKDNKYLPFGALRTAGCVELGGGKALCPNGQGTLAERSIENTALFGDIEFDFTDKFTSTLEIRRAKEEAEQLNQNALIDPAMGLPACNPALATNTPGVTIDGCRFAGEWTSTTPRVTLRYKLTPDMTLFLNGAKGNKPGGFNTASAVQAGINSNINVKSAYDEEESKAYEAGIKMDLLGGRARLNITAFKTDLTGQQLTSNVVGIVNGNAVLNSFIANIGETGITGLELEGNMRITEAWDASLTFSYVRSKVETFFDNNQVNLVSPNGAFTAVTGLANPANPGDNPFRFGATGTTQPSNNPLSFCRGATAPSTVGIQPGVVAAFNALPTCAAAIAADLAAYGSVAGNYSPRTPKVQASLSSSYTGNFANGLEWKLSGDVTYEGSKYGQVDNFSETGAHTYVGARFMISGEKWDLTFWGKNLFDDDTALDILRYIDTRNLTPATFSSPAFGSVTPRGFVVTFPKARQIGATFAYKF